MGWLHWVNTAETKVVEFLMEDLKNNMVQLGVEKVTQISKA